VTLLTVLLFLDAFVSRIDGVVLLVGLVIVMAWLTRIGLRSSVDDPMVAELEAEMPQYTSHIAIGIQLVLGLAALLLGADLLVRGAVDIAIRFGISDVVIGIVLVALGTSLPELAVSLASALKGEYGLALGNIVGSNIFNSLAVIGIAAAIQSAELPPSVVNLHIFVMGAFTIVLFASTYDLEGKQQISRLEGFAMLFAFLAYEIYTVVPNFVD
jgi:cation:H+ antiporter